MAKLGTDLGFKRITAMDIYEHDKMIAFTSQLAHAIAVSLVNSDKASVLVSPITLESS